MLFFTIVSLFALSRASSCRKILPGSPNVCYGNANDTFYKSFEDFLPNLEMSWGEDDVEIYMPNLDEVREQSGHAGCVHDDSFENDEDFKNKDFTGSPAYFSWVSKKYGQPILATTRGPGCGEGCPNEEGRGCTGQFQTCLISDVKRSDYTYSDLDRGHIVPNSAIGKWYNKSASTFSMCNIGTQERQLNQNDWKFLEHWIECLGTMEELVIHAGPLFNDKAMEYCACHETKETRGIVLCSECKTRGIPMAFAFWKVVVDSNYNAWSWIFTQEECMHAGDNCAKGHVYQSIDDAFNSNGLEFIASNLQMTWPGHFKQMTNMTALDAIIECPRNATRQKQVE